MFVYEQINHANPYATADELEFVRQEALKLNSDQQMVMIGAGPAVFGIASLEQHPNPPKMSIVDIATFYYCEAHMRGAGIDLNKVEFITGDSSTVGRNWHIPIDLLIVDGDHTYLGVLKDIDAWWNKVKVGGLIVFHDFLYREGGFNGTEAWHFQDVHRAIETRRDSTWAFIKQVGISAVYMKV